MAQIKTRNRHACPPILRKGGPHQKTRKAQRRAERAALRQKALD